MIRIIALAGPKGSGKDTVANYLVTRRHALRLSFADRMREVMSLIYDIPVDQFHDPVAKNLSHLNLPEGKTLRNALEFIGENPKQFDKLIWARPILRDIRRYREHAETTGHPITLVITDLRFPEEIVELKAESTEFYYVYRPEAEVRLLKSVKDGTVHRSESYNPDYKKQFTVISNIYDCSSPQFEQELLSTFYPGELHEPE